MVGKTLSGLRVLDLTHMLAGPYCTWILGALGAEIVKIERPGAGDFTRSLAPFVDRQSLYFMSVNRNKRSLTLNLKDERGKAIFRRLAARVDILVENNRPGVMDRLGLGYAELSTVNPRLIYASVSGFGQTGPLRERPAFDIAVQALSGMMSITGERDGPPCRVGASIGDIAASLFAAVGILSALEQRHRTGRGEYVDVAMLDCQLALLENAAARSLNTAEEPRRLGSRHPLVTPFQAFPTADEPLVVCVDTEQQWQRLCRAIDCAELAADPRFTGASERTRHHADLEPLLVAAFAKRGRTDWLERLAAADVPCASINSVGDALASAQVAARGMVVGTEGGPGRFVGLPIHFGGSGPGAEKAAPELGADTEAIAQELGISAADLAELRHGGAV